VRELEKPISRAWRRMRFQRFLTTLVWTWTVLLVGAAGSIAAEKFLGRPLYPAPWFPFAWAGGIGLLAAGLIAALTGPSRVDASVALDRAFHLNERLSTALTLPADLKATPAGQALVADAIRHVADLDVGDKFGPHLPRKAWVPVIPGLLAFGLFLVPADWVQRQVKAQDPKDALAKVDPEKVAKPAQNLTKRIGEARKDLDKAKFAESEKLMAEIERAADDLAKAPPAEKEKALVELNRLSDTLKDRQKQLGSADQINRQLQQLKQMGSDGPADEFAKQLARGDFEKAANELKQLQEKIASGKMTEPEKRQLQEQLGQMKQQLEKLANLEERRKQLEEAKKSGALSQDQFEQEMAKLNDQAQDLRKLQKLAQKLGEAQQQMAKGDMQKAADALGMSQEQLTQMAEQLQELETLDAAMADLQDAKNAMTGDGANQIGDRLSDMAGLGMGNDGNGNGNGLGRGRGRGDRPEAADQTATFNTKVKQQFGQGKAILEGFAPPGQQMKGESVILGQETVEAASGADADALSNQKVPKNVMKHVTGYFDEFSKDRP